MGNASRDDKREVERGLSIGAGKVQVPTVTPTNALSPLPPSNACSFPTATPAPVELDCSVAAAAARLD